MSDHWSICVVLFHPCDTLFLMQVDYQYDISTASYTQMLRHDQKLFSSNLAILLKWSPFASEAELVKQVCY